MSKKAAHVNNKMDVRIIVGRLQVEHITVHPNMFQVPRIGDGFKFTAMTRKVEKDPDDFTQELSAQYGGVVTDVTFSNAVVRTKTDGRYSTELLQEVTITINDPRVSQ